MGDGHREGTYIGSIPPCATQVPVDGRMDTCTWICISREFTTTLLKYTAELHCWNTTWDGSKDVYMWQITLKHIITIFKINLLSTTHLDLFQQAVAHGYTIIKSPNKSKYWKYWQPWPRKVGKQLTISGCVLVSWKISMQPCNHATHHGSDSRIFICIDSGLYVFLWLLYVLRYVCMYICIYVGATRCLNTSMVDPCSSPKVQWGSRLSTCKYQDLIGGETD